MTLSTKRYFLKQRISKLFKKFTYSLLPYPLEMKGGQYSMIHPYFDSPDGNPSRYIYNLAIKAISQADNFKFDDLIVRNPSEAIFLNNIPGDHYKLLASLVQILNPKSIVEIGTFTGLSSLAMKKYMPEDCKLTTFDIIDSFKYKNCIFKNEDFADNRLVQEIADVTDFEVFKKYQDLFENADFIFLDAAKDKIQERKFFENFSKCQFKKRPIIVLDDIRVWNMIRIWEWIPYPKMDVTSFGHFSGTGIVDINYAAFKDGLMNK